MGEADEKLDGKKKVRWGSRKHVFNRIRVFVGHFGLFVALIIYTGVGALVSSFEFFDAFIHIT